MIKNLIKKMLLAQTISALTVSLCLLIDNIMIGRFLGVYALASYGLANPVLLVIGALGTTLSAGVQVACSRSLGKGSQEETNAGYSCSIFIAASISVLFILLILIFRIPFAQLMGANTPELLENTSTYMAGFVIGAPASMGALILVPFLQMAGQGNLLIAAVLGMTVADVGLDLLNGFVLHWGMFGMGLASSVSYYIALLIGGWFFLSKKSTFRFSFKLVTFAKIKELIAGGVPSIVGMAASVVLVFVMNKILMNAGGSVAVAAFSVISTIGNASNCISTGSGGVALTLSGILYNEEDRTGLTELVKLLIRYTLLMGIGACIVLLVFSPYLVGLFIPEDGEPRILATLGLRIFAFGLIPSCLNNALRSYYQGIGRVKTMELISLLENAIFPIFSAFVLSAIAGINGAWFYFVCGDLLTFLFILCLVWSNNKSFPRNPRQMLLLPEGFGVSPENLLEADLNDRDEVIAFSEKAEAFCRSYSRDPQLPRKLALCIEEIGLNVINYGFKAGGKDHHLSIRLLHKEQCSILRFRDDCGAFDPISHIPAPRENEQFGLLLTMHMADDARYTYSLSLNNLMLVFNINNTGKPA